MEKMEYKNEKPTMTTMSKEQLDMAIGNEVNDPSLKDVLDVNEAMTKEIEATLVTKEDLSQLLEEIEDMTYVELNSALSQLKSAKTMLKFVNGVGEQISTISGVVNAQIQMTNYLTKFGLDDTYKDGEDFMDRYLEDIENLDSAIEILENKLAGYGDKAKSSKFLTDQMLQSLEKRREAYRKAYTGEESVYDDYEYKKISNTMGIYKHRTDLSWIHTDAGRSLRKVKKAIREANRIGYDKVNEIKRIKADLEKQYSKPEVLGAIEKWLVEIFDGDDIAAAVCLGHMRRILETEKAFGNDNWAKVFLMNAQDIIVGIYDLDLPVEDYIQQVKELYPFYKIES